ncbi:MAG: MFS transporter [Prevotellaceae bacterium]|jgi:MFS family permease|nr:MFS transporter [Prevotellaceae bacterium]
MQKILSQSKGARWAALAIVSVTMFCGYFFTDVMAPLKPMLESELGWSSDDYGLFTSAYGWFNIFFLILIFGGIILDRMGMRFTGILSAGIMLLGASIKYWAISTTFPEGATILGIRSQVAFASIGFATFGVGVEVAGITVTKIIVKWFKGKEMALAMGLQVGVARIGTMLSMAAPIPLAKAFGSISAPLLVCVIVLCIGFLSFLVYGVMDKKLDKELGIDKNTTHEDEFKLSDIGFILKNKGFWLIALLCLLFYSGVFPFLKYAVDLMINKFNVQPEFAGNISAILPFGTLLLTPVFGHLYDRIGKGASMMILGATLLTLIHVTFALPFVHFWPIAVGLMVLLGIAFSLVPSAMWPSVPKIIPEKQLGTAYSLIFYIQNFGLSGVPFIIGKILSNYCITGTNAEGGNTYDYTLPMVVFAVLGGLSVLTAFALKAENSKKGYGLELPNTKR